MFKNSISGGLGFCCFHSQYESCSRWGRCTLVITYTIPDTRVMIEMLGTKSSAMQYQSMVSGKNNLIYTHTHTHTHTHAQTHTNTHTHTHTCTHTHTHAHAPSSPHTYLSYKGVGLHSAIGIHLGHVHVIDEVH